MVKLLVKIVVVLALLLGGAAGIIWWGYGLSKEECTYLLENLDISSADDAKDFVRVCTYKGEVVHEEREEFIAGSHDTCFSKPWDTSRLVAALQQDGCTVTLGEPGELTLSRRVRHGLFTVEHSATVWLVRVFSISQQANPSFLGIPLPGCGIGTSRSGSVIYEDWFPDSDAEIPGNDDASSS